MAGFNTYGRITLRLITLRITDHAEYVSPAKDLQVLVEIVHSGSFSAAAATLGQTPAFVTKRIQILESTLGATLLSRSARGVALTEVANVAMNTRKRSSQVINIWSMTLRNSKRVRQE